MLTSIFVTSLTLAGSAAAACSSYTIIDTRGTGEAQGPSAGFRTMNSNVMRQLPGGKEYDTVYPADYSQNSASGTQDIINKITSTLQSSPQECFILEGYSQGAAATVDAMSRITGSAFDAVKGVFLIGDPEHKPGLSCNVDNNGGKSTANAQGIESYKGGIPTNWQSKTLDVCIQGDGVCSGGGITSQHLQYPNDAPTQNLGTNFIVKQLSAGGTSPSPSPAPAPSPAPGFPSPGFPSPGFPSPGFPSPGFPSPGFPSPGFPSPGFPSPGFPSPGFPRPGFPRPGFPRPGFPRPGFPSPGPA